MEFKKGDRVQFRLRESAPKHAKEFVETCSKGHIGIILSKFDESYYEVDLRNCPSLSMSSGLVHKKGIYPATISKGV